MKRDKSVPEQGSETGSGECGMQSQSIDPCLETRGAVWQSPIIEEALRRDLP
jgi:hypothetical protein